MPAALPPFLFVGAVLLMTAGLLEGWLDDRGGVADPGEPHRRLVDLVGELR
jgi:hypothetical protein